MIRHVASGMLVVVAVGCDSPAARAPDSLATAASAVALDSTHLIRPDGIAHVRPGMTIGALRSALPAGWTLGAPAPFMVDISALAVARGNDSLYYVLVPSGEPTGDDAAITMVATDDTTFRTALGVGPGTTIERAVAIYGPATLSYSTSDESREYVTFAGYQNPTVLFRATASTEGGLAGMYATDGEHNTTETYDPHAWIGLVTVRLRP